jgi:hypothetical protein
MQVILFRESCVLQCIVSSRYVCPLSQPGTLAEGAGQTRSGMHPQLRKHRLCVCAAGTGHRDQCQLAPIAVTDFGKVSDCHCRRQLALCVSCVYTREHSICQPVVVQSHLLVHVSRVKGCGDDNISIIQMLVQHCKVHLTVTVTRCMPC